MPFPPPEPTLLDRLTGSSDPASSEKAEFGETRKQHDHYIGKDPAHQHTTSDADGGNTDDEKAVAPP